MGLALTTELDGTKTVIRNKNEYKNPDPSNRNKWD